MKLLIPYKRLVLISLLMGFLCLLSACGGSGNSSSSEEETVAGTFAPVSSVVACEDMVNQDFSNIAEAPAVITSAEVFVDEDDNETNLCHIKGTISGRQNFEMKLPIDEWTQRFMMQAGGGYGGWAYRTTYSSNMGYGCQEFESEEMVVASTDNGHTNTYWPQGTWAIGNPQGMIDFAYLGVHKMTVLGKQIIETFYGQPATKSYIMGCSYGGLGAMQEAQRYPTDYDGILAGSPTIDDTETNTFWHGWFVRVNSDSESNPILTVDKIPALSAAVIEACGDEGGLIQDPRLCEFDVETIQCEDGVDSAECLTAEQIDVVKKIWDGPRDEYGNRLTAKGMPVGSEMSWLGSMVPRTMGDKISWDTSGDYQWSYEFPMYMSTFGEVTGITNQNIEFTNDSFYQLTTLATMINPTNPDLSEFAANGGKLIMWQGWADSGTTPYNPLNYWAAAKGTMGEYALTNFLKLYMVAGVGHCGNGTYKVNMDMITPLLDWVENGTEPNMVPVEFNDSDSTLVMTRPAYPYPSMVEYVGGDADVSLIDSWSRTDLPSSPAINDFTYFLGLDNYVPGKQMWCEVINGAPECWEE